ncbi:hypothetical protein HDR66_03010 [bacterium]|nr:hypothetical protein [bacterium]
MTHTEIWNAIDAFVESQQMSCARMARFSGLNSTTLNKSKRRTRDGKDRWPSMHSIAKMLDASNLYMMDFARFCPMPRDRDHERA